ncbi:hypothetical protein ACRALDRAFT_2041702 [Sodiomyces alcalophilus JCM 7366]|uniref:uncharacterized protein n=1 Tax=Sodiomyces alcalophilus JCM 7366 TaxID=591952 RepID=UPI0039B5A018
MDGIMDACFPRDESFDFTTPFLSSSASSPTYDSADPFTPRSGRSTPHGPSIDLGDSFSSNNSYSPHGSFSFEPTAPMPMPKGHYNSKHGSIDSFQYPVPMPLTPTRQEHGHGFPGMDVDYNTMLQFTLEQQSMSNMSPTQTSMMGHHYPTQQVLQSSPFAMPTPSRSLHNSTPNNTASMWPCNSESPIVMFGPLHTPSPPPTQMARRGDESPTMSPSSRSYRRRGPMAEAQRTAMALQRYVNEKMRREQRDKELFSRYKATKVEQHHVRPKPKRELDTVLTDGEVLVPSPRERCNFAGCRKTYQKKEHLKRHQRAAHSIGGTPEMYACPADGCGKVFKDRFDNFKQHLRIHKDGKSTRTPYSEEAARLYDSLRKQSKLRKRAHRNAAGEECFCSSCPPAERQSRTSNL